MKTKKIGPIAPFGLFTLFLQHFKGYFFPDTKLVLRTIPKPLFTRSVNFFFEHHTNTDTNFQVTRFFITFYQHACWVLLSAFFVQNICGTSNNIYVDNSYYHAQDRSVYTYDSNTDTEVAAKQRFAVLTRIYFPVTSK